jgi:hypothetical protein
VRLVTLYSEWADGLTQVDIGELEHAEALAFKAVHQAFTRASNERAEREIAGR